MTKAQIIAAVGEDNYRQASLDLTIVALDEGTKYLGPPSPDLPHEIADLIWDASLSFARKIELLFEVYDDMPGYGHLMYVTHYYDDFSSQDRQLWWNCVRQRLASDNPALSRPVQYSLWCDFFENPETVDEAWNHLTPQEADDRVLEAALEASGPVPYKTKQVLYDRLTGDPKWHRWIVRSLFHSAVDVHGDINKRDALRRLRDLDASDSEELTELRRRLGFWSRLTDR